MKPPIRTRRRSYFAALTLLAVILPIQFSSQAFATDQLTLITETTAQITFTGTAQISGNIGVSQDIQIPQLALDFGPQQPIMWAVYIENTSGAILASFSWDYSATGPPSFSFGLQTGNQVNPNSSGATCYTTPVTYCVDNVNYWNWADPLRVTFAPDVSLGANWWNGTILDLKSGTKLDLGSIKDVYPQTPTVVQVQDSMYRSAYVDNCPGDAAPIADTYFGPIVDSAGGVDLLPTRPIESHACVNSVLLTSPNYVGGFLLYGGSKSSITSPPRTGLFIPSPLITSATPPTPDSPTNFVETTSNGVLNMIVQAPNFQAKGVNSIYLVAPELGYQAESPISTTIVGDTGQISFPILPGLVNVPIHLSFYASNGYLSSDPFTTVLTIPPSALPPVHFPGSGGAHSIPSGINPAPNTKSVPSAPQGVKASIVKNQLIITANSAQSKGTGVSGALLVSTPFGLTSDKPLQASLASGTAQFKLKLTKALSKKTVPFTIYFYNDLGVSSAYSSKVKIP